MTPVPRPSKPSHAMIGPAIPTQLLQGVSTEEEDGPSVGPQIPPELLNQASSINDANRPPPDEREEDEEEDDYMPALPPELVAKRGQASSSSSIQKPASLPTQSIPVPPARRPLGPSFPSYGPEYNSSSYFQPSNPDDDSDDDVGPKPLPAGMRHTDKDPVAEFMEREERRRKNEEEAKKPKALKREEWMLVPPSAGDLLSNLDTTKLKPRQFARTSGPVVKADNNLWTETPAERQQRIADEVAGKKRRAVDVANNVDDVASERVKRNRRDEDDIRRGVDEYTKTRRGPSLVDQHGVKGKPEDEDESKKVIWDHGRDMSIGGRLMDDGKRSQMIKEAKGLGDRFGSGKGGSFL